MVRCLLVQAFTHAFAHFEERNVFSHNINAFTGARVTAAAGFTMTDGKCPETAQFNTVATGQRL